MAGAMGSTAKTMAAVNQQLKVEDIQKTMMNFEKESSKMDIAGELSKLVLFLRLVDPFLDRLTRLVIQAY